MTTPIEKKEGKCPHQNVRYRYGSGGFECNDCGQQVHSKKYDQLNTNQEKWGKVDERFDDWRNDGEHESLSDKNGIISIWEVRMLKEYFHSELERFGIEIIEEISNDVFKLSQTHEIEPELIICVDRDFLDDRLEAKLATLKNK